MKNIKTAMQVYKESQARKQKKEEEGLSDYKKQLLHNRRSRLNQVKQYVVLYSNQEDDLTHIWIDCKESVKALNEYTVLIDETVKINIDGVIVNIIEDHGFMYE